MISIEFLRQFRFGGFAIFDFVVAFLGMAILSPLLSGAFKKIGIHIPKKNWVLLTIPIGILAHILFSVSTPLTRNFLDINGHYLEKIIVLAFFGSGLLGIKRIKRKNT